MTSFVSDRKQRLVYNGTVCDWMMISKGTMQGSVSRPHLFNLFLDDDLKTNSNLDDALGAAQRLSKSQNHGILCGTEDSAMSAMCFGDSCKSADHSEIALIRL